MADLPAQYREVLVPREMEDLFYQEVANTVGVPIGTVMSRLSRARKRLRQDLVCLMRPPTREAPESSLTTVVSEKCGPAAWQ
jgi:predicted RNA polymerase sigma factor